MVKHFQVQKIFYSDKDKQTQNLCSKFAFYDLRKHNKSLSQYFPIPYNNSKKYTHIFTHGTFPLIIIGGSSFIVGARASFVLFKYWLSSYSDVRVSKARVMDIKSLIKPVYTLHTQMRREGERAWPTNVPDSESGPSHIVRRKRDLHRENMLISKRTLYSGLC